MLQEMDISALVEKEHVLDQYQPASVPQHIRADNDTADNRSNMFQSEHSRFDYPAWIWTAMFACYAIFFAAITLATGHDGGTLFMIGISVAYTVMYFGTASILSGLNRQDTRTVSRIIPAIDTWTGKLTVKEAAAQILTVPAMLALFAIGIAIICAVVM